MIAVRMAADPWETLRVGEERFVGLAEPHLVGQNDSSPLFDEQTREGAAHGPLTCVRVDQSVISPNSWVRASAERARADALRFAGSVVSTAISAFPSGGRVRKAALVKFGEP